ncbi:MAG TPA: branched-chain amino acid ABC transporter permease [Gaiellaceae bacterium]|nr:branched-chain amino acid ABC transporter permease [Gaiellaceae bacterium]
MTEHPEGTHVGTQGDSPREAIGLRNRLRATWRALSFEQRAAVSIGAEIALAILFFFVDRALGYAVLTLSALYWIHRLPPLPWKLAAQAVLVVLFLVFGPASFGILLAIGFAVFWVPPRWRGWAVPLVAIGAAVFYPFYQPKMFTIPVFGAWPDVATGVVMLVFVMMAVGLNIVVGYAGLLDLGYVAFYATGAYTAAWFASQQFAGQKCPKPGVSVDNCPVAAVPAHSFDFGAVGLVPGLGGIHISGWLLLLLAGVITAFAGIVIGLPTLRLRGDYLAIVTLGFGEILPQIARNGDNLFGTGFNLTNGPNGITPLDSIGFGNRVSDWTGGVLPSNFLACCNAKHLGHQIQSTDLFFWTAIVLLLITVFCSLRLQYSRLGRAWIAIREDETAAAAMGIPLMRTKTWAYASGAFFGGVAGAYYAIFRSATFPGDFFFNISVFILCMVILGGMGNIWGVIVGAAFLAYLDREGLANTGAWINSNVHVGGWHPNIEVPLYASGIYGVIILIVMLFRPEGLIPSRRRAAELHEGVHDEPLYEATHAGAEA